MHCWPRPGQLTGALNRGRTLALVLMMLAAPAVMAGDAGAWVWPDWPLLRLAGRLHPLLVHFPIALLLCAALLEGLRILRGQGNVAALAGAGGSQGVALKPRVTDTVRTLTVLGALGAVAAAGAGWLNAEYEAPSTTTATTLFFHRWTGVAAAALAVVAWVAAVLARRTRWSWPLHVFRLALLLTAAGVGIGGHLGGTLVYGEGYYWEAFRAPSEPVTPDAASLARRSGEALPGAELVDYERDIAPILAARCVSCHGPQRQKGKLRLDDLNVALQRAGVFVPGNSAGSEAFRRVSLPPDDADFMPAVGDPLTASQIELLRRWIDGMTGAPPVGGDAAPRDAAARAPVAAPSGAAQEPGSAPDGPRLSEAQRAARDAALTAIRARGGLAIAVAQSSEWIDVRLGLLAQNAGDAELDLLRGLEPVLVGLDLSGTRVSDAGLARLAAFSHLARLNVSRTAISDAGLDAIARLTALEYLNLYATDVSDAGLARLARLAKLQRLYVWQTKTTDAGISALCEAIPGLVIGSGRSAAAQPASTPSVASASPGAAPSGGTPKCCAAAVALGKVCDHPCCIDAAKAGHVCAKCPAQ